ncbi:Gamma-glutamyl cyclotransferase, AIG2-like [Micromonospora rhizosphaerae]|uniref:Gamma-glutamyl cyclotransferase, AIG2-like n=1 Tax=Micromonospora rhizosphaerae TaxID=568872 RepID=A0A1C6RUE8_9ACTN|nr:gamma-glutamylcyclotransferase family protein [Micromonospora rhizosphaerae]SCL20795.1 Gamma-glutamyl cyclotransferase, AIG2-like [Micromonospora rhizosphaerae]
MRNFLDQVLAGPTLSDPVWQGIGAIAAVVSVGLYLWFEIWRRHQWQPGPTTTSARVRHFQLDEPSEEKAFYAELADSISKAKQSIYRSGRGFNHDAHESYGVQLISAEREALNRGVEVSRIQTSEPVIESWADGFANLLEMFPQKLKVFADPASPPLVNVGVIDPLSNQPVIQLLFETNEPDSNGSRSQGATAIFLYGQKSLAVSLAYQFSARTAKLAPMTAAAMRNLARSYIYFAYGSNTSTGQMRARVPGARPIGKAVLYGWKLNFRVSAPHFDDGFAAGVERSSDDDFVEGVAYSLSISDKRSLDEIEFGGYKPAIVNIKVDGEHVEAYVHVPLALSKRTDALPPIPYIELMIAGAKEYGLSNSLARLESMRERAYRKKASQVAGVQVQYKGLLQRMAIPDLFGVNEDTRHRSLSSDGVLYCRAGRLCCLVSSVGGRCWSSRCLIAASPASARAGEGP